MEPINKKIAIAAVIMAFITSLFVYFYLSGLKKHEAKVEFVTIYTAKEIIPAKMNIDSTMIEEVKIPVDITLPKGILNKEEIIGKLTKERILAGEPILEERLIPSKNPTMAYIIPKGKRAVTIGVNEVIEVGDFIYPGDHIDVLATFEEEEKEDEHGSIRYPKMTKTILQNILILGVGQSMTEDKKAHSSDKMLPSSVTIAVDLEEAEKLVLADESGVLRLALRPKLEDTIYETSGSIRDDLMPSKATSKK